jgi:LPS sulfotransferase NodH
MINSKKLIAAEKFSEMIAKVVSIPDNYLVNEPVFIIGCGRSGTTLLARALNEHSNIGVFPTEANNLWHPELYPWHESEVDCPPIWLNPVEFSNTSIQTWPPGWNNYIEKVFTIYKNISGSSIFLNKSAMITFFVPMIKRIFESPKFLHIYRDGRAVAKSYVSKEFKKFNANDNYNKLEVTDGKSKLEKQFLKYWSKHLEKIEEYKNNIFYSEEILEVRYEQLSYKPVQNIERILEFIGVKKSLSDEDVPDIQNRNKKYDLKNSTIYLRGNESNVYKTLANKSYL